MSSSRGFNLACAERVRSEFKRVYDMFWDSDKVVCVIHEWFDQLESIHTLSRRPKFFDRTSVAATRSP